MERERWSLIEQVIREVAASLRWDDARCTHRTSNIVRVHLWSVSHDRPTVWACDRANWRGTPIGGALPDQSTMSRRMRRPPFERFLIEVGRRLNLIDDQRCPGSARSVRDDAPLIAVKRLDGKPLQLPMHSGDRDAAAGRGVRGIGRGYKLHAIHSGKPMPDAFAITPLNVCEKKMARRLLKRLDVAPGYLLADAGYDASAVHDAALHRGLQLLCPRNKPGTGLGNCYQSPGRLRSMQMLEGPWMLEPRFGTQLYQRRRDIERDFAALSCFGGGLAPLPTWVRRPWRVRRWIIAKLLINAARIVQLRRKKAA
jgi:hypothetical protein